MKKKKLLMFILFVLLIMHTPVQNFAWSKSDDRLFEFKEVAIPIPLTVNGWVVDPNGEPLIGVNIQVKGSNKGTSTDIEGHFSVEDINDNDVLIVSYVGYQTREISVSGRSELTITMVSDSHLLDEVVVVGYGTQKKENLTGAVDVVTEEQIESRPVSNLSEALQGVSPNLNVTSTGMSGEPGGEMSFNIRGTGTLTGDDAPYVLVDGVPMDMNSVNPNDVKSITVLKDAAASAIYGARAPYGVILITTKRGDVSKGIQIQYNNNISFSSPIGLPHMASSLKYAAAHDQASVNAGLAPNFTPENYERIRKYIEGEITEETWLMPDGSDWAGNGIWSIAGNGNNDWMYIYYDDLVMRQKHDVSLSGGGANNSFYVSGSFWDQPGELQYGDEFYKRYNVSANLTSHATDWLTLNINTKFIDDHTQHFNTRQGWSRSTMYHNFYRNNPFRPLRLPNGEFSNISYIPMLNGGKNSQYGTNFIISGQATLEPINNWKTKLSYNYKYNGLREDDNSQTVYGTDPNENKYVIAYPISSYATRFNNANYNLFNIVSSYTKNINNHNFYFLGGFEYEQNEFYSLVGKKNDILTSKVPSISTSTGELFVDDSRSHWAVMGFFGRFTYNYAEKYLLEINGRYDGSSKFEERSRWGFFPSISLGYNISKENFWNSIFPSINNFKIRASWGELGNQNVPNYLYLSTLGIGTQLGWITGSERPNYTTAPGLVSANLTWETSTTTNLGLDIGFLEDKLSSSIDIYRRVTTNMFGPAEALPRTLGTSVPRANNATLETKGFEISLGWRDHLAQDFDYNIRFTLADNASKVTKYNNPTKTLSTWYEDARIGEIWGLETVGIYQSDADAENGPDQSLFYPTWGAGDIHYKDITGDNTIDRGNGTAENSGDYKVIGNNSPRFLTGLDMGLKWKNLSFQMFWQGVLKRDYAFSGGDMTFFGFNGHQWWGMNVWEQTVDYWRPGNETNILGPNTSGYYPKPYLSQEDYKNKEVQTRFMQNASYLRLKNLNIGYSLPKELISRLKIDQVRLFISGENLLTLTSLIKLYDPEALSDIGWGVGKIHPLRKIYAVGINVKF